MARIYVDEGIQPRRCVRCGADGQLGDRCTHCGVSMSRPVQRRRRRRSIGGKRGRNSGTVGTAKKK